MAEKLYVNKPGGVIVHLRDGTAESLAYGDPVDKHGPLADYVDPKRFADSNPRKLPNAQEVDAHTRAALTEGGQVNSSSSAVPGNYNELDEDGAAQLVSNLGRFPRAQAEIVLHEIISNSGGRQRVLDAASEFALVDAQSRIEAARDAGVEEPTDPGTDPVLTSDLGDPQLRPDDPAQADRIAERALKLTGHAGERRTPAPRTEQRSDTQAAEDGLDEEERAALESRHGDGDPDGGEPVGFEDATKAQLVAYAEQHDIEVKKSGKVDEIRAEIEKVHPEPQTPLE